MIGPMRTWLVTAWEHMRGSYWFIPSLMALLSVGLSFLTTSIDRTIKMEKPSEWNYIYTGGAEGARELFSTVAGSMITVAGVVFSITVVSLTLAAQQYGSRLLYNFMRDRGNQVVLGTFLATYVFCILALRTVRGGDENGFVPHVSVTVAVVLAMASLCVLIFFIHHVAASIDPANIIAAVGRELDEVIDHLFPEKIGEPTGEGVGPATAGSLELIRTTRRCTVVCATKGGYVQYLDGDSLMELARSCDWVVQILKRPGSWVVEDDPLAYVWSLGEPEEQNVKKLRETILIGHERTSPQDLIFPINQFVQLAQRALSPGINDPHTAALCVDRLGRSLIKLIRRQVPTGFREDSDGNLRLITRPHTFEDALEAAIDPIREFGIASVQVTRRLLKTLEALASRASTEEQKSAIRKQIEVLLACVSTRESLCQRDRENLLKAIRESLTDNEAAIA